MYCIKYTSHFTWMLTNTVRRNARPTDEKLLTSDTFTNHLHYTRGLYLFMQKLTLPPLKLDFIYEALVNKYILF